MEPSNWTKTTGLKPDDPIRKQLMKEARTKP
jgi:hypothetical protein